MIEINLNGEYVADRIVKKLALLAIQYDDVDEFIDEASKDEDFSELNNVFGKLRMKDVFYYSRSEVYYLTASCRSIDNEFWYLGIVDYDGNSTTEVDQAMFFESEKEAEDYAKKIDDWREGTKFTVVPIERGVYNWDSVSFEKI